MRQSTNYELNLVEGNDLVNPLTQDVPNYEKIDEVMKANEMASIGAAVELVSATVHAITRTWKDTPMFKFTATANYTAGETFTVDGLQVTALLPSGEPLASGCYITGSEVLCYLNSNTMLMTVFVSGGTVTLAQNSERLGGELPDYYGKNSDVVTAQNTATAAGVLAQSAQSEVTTLKTLSDIEQIIGVDDLGNTIYRKVCKGTISTSSTVGERRIFNAILESDAKRIIRSDGWLRWANETDLRRSLKSIGIDTSMNVVFGSSVDCSGTNGASITAFNRTNQSATSVDYYVVIEYTK